MDRLTTDNPKDNIETALNLFYIKDHETWVRGYGPNFDDVNLFDLIRTIVKVHVPGEELPTDNDDLANMMAEWLDYDVYTAEGVIALLNVAAWAYSTLRHKLMQYEDAEQDGRLWMLAVSPWPRPCKSNNVYIIDDGEIYEDSVTGANIGMGPDGDIVCYYETFDGDAFYQKDIGKTVFLTREEAEAALKGGAK